VGVEFTSYRRETSFKACGVGLSRKPGDQTKNSFTNRQIVDNVSFPTFDFFRKVIIFINVPRVVGLFPRILYCFPIEMVFRSVSDRFGRRLGEGL
jgi:hypothetical protein